MLPILAKPELRDPEDGDQASTAHCLPALGLNNSELAGDCGKVTFPLMWFLTPSRHPQEQPPWQSGWSRLHSSRLWL